MIVNGESTKESEHSLGDGRQRVPRATLHRMGVVIGKYLRPLEGAHIEDVHVIHANLSISTAKHENAIVHTGCSVGSPGHRNGARAFGPFPAIRHWIVADKLIAPSPKVVLRRKQERRRVSERRDVIYDSNIAATR